jgi:hypothetical protein
MDCVYSILISCRALLLTAGSRVIKSGWWGKIIQGGVARILFGPHRTELQEKRFLSGLPAYLV